MHNFYQGKKILITGHTGFKGSWLTKILVGFGAEVSGYALKAPTNPSLFELIDFGSSIHHHIGDVCDYENLLSVFKQAQPDIVFHLAAQPIVRESYKNPRATYEVNVMGTVNVLECIRQTNSVKSVVIITTDKVYKNNEWIYGYRENDVLDGFDPYSNSKSCAELVTASYTRAFLSEKGIAVSTARAGNVIGGGDFALDRIIPDCVRALESNATLEIRNPYSTRPYQHVLEPLFVYLKIAQDQLNDPTKAGQYNVGPNDEDCVSTGQLVKLFENALKRQSNRQFKYQIVKNNGPHEANFLKLDSSSIKSQFGWQPTWKISDAIDKTIEWTLSYFENEDINAVMEKQITTFITSQEETWKEI